jgi:hypothetical protein
LPCPSPWENLSPTALPVAHGRRGGVLGGQLRIALAVLAGLGAFLQEPSGDVLDARGALCAIFTVEKFRRILILEIEAVGDAGRPARNVRPAHLCSRRDVLIRFAGGNGDQAGSCRGWFQAQERRWLHALHRRAPKWSSWTRTARRALYRTIAFCSCAAAGRSLHRHCQFWEEFL